MLSLIHILKGDNEDETTGIEIIKRAIEEPLRQIVANAGKELSLIHILLRQGLHRLASRRCGIRVHILHGNIPKWFHALMRNG